MTAWTRPNLTAPDAVSLTPSQAEVLTALCHGLSNAEIGHRLFITENTVRVHMRHLRRKFAAHDRSHVAGLAMSGQVPIDIDDAGTFAEWKKS